jgi:putative flippase GtrA
VFAVDLQGRFWRFFGVFGLAYVVNVAVQAVILGMGWASGYLAGAVGTVVAATLAYLGNRYWVFAQ